MFSEHHWLRIYATIAYRIVAYSFIRIAERITQHPIFKFKEDDARIRWFRLLITYHQMDDAPPPEGAVIQETLYEPPGAELIIFNRIILGRGQSVRSKKLPDRCIYCGDKYYQRSAGRLTDEHVINEAFDARYVIPNASCRKCQTATNYFENKLIQDTYEASNKKLGIQGKRRKNRKTRYPITVLINGEQKRWTPTLDIHPTMLCLPIVDAAGILNKREKSKSGIKNLWVKFLNTHDQIIQSGYPKFTSPSIDTVHFCQFVAKVAHGFAVGELGVDGFEPYLTPYIRHVYRHKYDVWNDRFHYIGGELQEFAPSRGFHELGWSIIQIDGEPHIIVAVRLFAEFGAPLFHAIVGKLNPVQLARAQAQTEHS